jgi:plasmid stability protein
MGTLSLKNFPDDLHEQAKSRAALEGITLKELVEQAVSGYLASPITLDVEEVIVKKRDSEEE